MIPQLAAARAVASRVRDQFTWARLWAVLCLVLAVNTYVAVHIPVPLLPDLKWEGWKPKADRLEREAEGCETRHNATRKSLAEMQARLEAMVKDGEARQKRQREAVEAQKPVSAALDRQIGAIRRERAVATPVGQECRSAESVLSAEGL